MSQILTTQTENYTTFSSPLYQNWYPYTSNVGANLINTVYLLYNLHTPSNYPQKTIAIKIKDFLTGDYPQYSEFRLRIQKQDVSGSTNATLDWLQESFTNGLSLNNNISLFNGMTTDINLQINTSNFYSINQYKKNIVFEVEGKNTSNTWEQIPQTYTVSLVLEVVNQPVTISPTNLTINFYKNTPSIPVLVELSGVDWTIFARTVSGEGMYEESHVYFESDDTSVICQPINNAPFFIGNEAKGTGTKTVKVLLNSAFYNTLEDNTTTFKKLRLYQGNNVFVSDVWLTVNVWPQNIFLVTPNVLNYTGVKNVIEPQSKEVTIFSNYPFTIQSKPTWLDTTILSNIIHAVPIPTLSMGAGIYTGDMVIESNNQIKTVAINYTLSTGIVLPHALSRINLTLDQDYILFQSLSNNTYFEVYLHIKISDRDGIIKEHNLNMKIPLLNQKGRLSIGKTVHRLMRNLNFDDQPRKYLLAIVNMSILEKNSTTQISLYNINNIYYLAGKTNKNISALREIGYLDIYEGTTRVFKNTSYPLNLFSKNKVFNLEFYKNGILEFGYTSPTQFQIDDQNFTFSFANPGDLLEIKLINVTETITKKFICFPKPLQKYVLGYENDYKMMGILECTGEISMSSEYKYYTNVKYENLVETLENVSNERQTKLIIHTGFLLKEEHQVIDAILRSPRCRLFTDVTLTSGIDLIPLSKDIAEMSTDQSLYSYKLEFLINRTHHEKVYSI